MNTSNSPGKPRTITIPGVGQGLRRGGGTGSNNPPAGTPPVERAEKLLKDTP